MDDARHAWRQGLFTHDRHDGPREGEDGAFEVRDCRRVRARERSAAGSAFQGVATLRKFGGGRTALAEAAHEPLPRLAALLGMDGFRPSRRRVGGRGHAPDGRVLHALFRRGALGDDIQSLHLRPAGHFPRPVGKGRRGVESAQLRRAEVPGFASAPRTFG